MRIPQIITLEPVMNADREEPEVKHPPHKIWAIFWPELLSPSPIFDLQHVILQNLYCDLPNRPLASFGASNPTLVGNASVSPLTTSHETHYSSELTSDVNGVRRN